MTEHPMPAPCGIDCAACDIYRAAQSPDAAVRLAEAWQGDAKPEWFRCQGCRGERAVRWCEDCHLADCCADKQLQDCSECAEFPCQPYLDWTHPYPHHQAAYERLQQRRAARE